MFRDATSSLDGIFMSETRNGAAAVAGVQNEMMLAAGDH